MAVTDGATYSAFKGKLTLYDLERVTQTGANVFAKNELQHPAPCSVLPPLLTPERTLAVDRGLRAGSLPPSTHKYSSILTAFAAHYLNGGGGQSSENREI